MTHQELTEILEIIGIESETIVLKEPDYLSAIVGVDTENARLIYDYNKMVDSLITEEGMSEEDAIDWLEYNTLRAIPYMGEHAPIVMHGIKELQEN